MPISKIFQLEHLPQEFPAGASAGYGWNNSGIPYWRWTGQNSAYSVICPRIVGNKLVISHNKGSTSPPTGVMSIKFDSLIGGVVPNKVTVGFRAVRMKNPYSACNIFTLNSTTTSTANGFWIAVSMGHIPTLNVPVYFEVELDFVARTQSLYIDGVLSTFQNMSIYLVASNINNWFWQIGTETSAPIENSSMMADDTPVFGIYDVYCTVDMGDVNDQYRGRLGPISVRKLPIKSSNGAPWETSAGWDLVAALKEPRDFSTAAASPFIRNDIAKSPLALKLDTSSILTGETVVAMSVNATPFRDSSTGAVLNTSLRYGTVSTPMLSVTPSVLAPGPDTTLGTVQVLPGGGALTKAALDETEIVFTPV